MKKKSQLQQYQLVIGKSQNYGNLLHHYVLYEKAVVAGRKQLILNCKNVKTDNLNLKILEKYR